MIWRMLKKMACNHDFKETDFRNIEIEEYKIGEPNVLKDHIFTCLHCGKISHHYVESFNMKNKIHSGGSHGTSRKNASRGFS